ncbi:MAG TPA: EthD family reductase [Caulobacter sp.]|nr:EthD family reductase [Caulobacter sp.]
MSVIFSVLYPAKPGAWFDQDYYDNVHIPLLRQAFTPTGLVDVTVFRPITAPDAMPTFERMVHLTFGAMETLLASLEGPRAPEVLADLAKFTDIQPITQMLTSD